MHRHDRTGSDASACHTLGALAIAANCGKAILQCLGSAKNAVGPQSPPTMGTLNLC
jgi:hypothetical protein